MKIKFCGAADGVTGSCHLLTSGEHKILLDCGQFQGGKAQDAKNFEEFPFDPAEVECVVLSHAHIDHCGRLPLLVKKGFSGKIYCTSATADLLDVMLKDSGYIHEKEAEWKNRKNERAGRPLVDPLYTVKDSEKALKYVEPILYDQLIEINDDMKIVFNDAGHILGSAITELWVEENENVSKIVFSGDLGVKGRPILRDPTVIKKADHLIMETTYGNRLHPKNTSGVDDLMEIIVRTKRRGGTVVIPSFAVGRTQELIYELNRYYEGNNKYKKDLEDLDVYIDSPMATTATEVFKKNVQAFDDETKEYILKGDNPLDFKNLKFTRTTEESQRLNMDRTPKIIISASGMCEAGRIRHHLKHNLWDKKSSIVFVGYQAEGTLGKNLIGGLKEVVLFGEPVQVNAEIYNLEGFSGHADRDGLLEWLSGFEKKPDQIFLVHGEEDSKTAFAETVKEKLGYETTTVEGVSEFELETATLLSREEAIRDTMDQETLGNIKEKIAEVHGQLENVLYNSSLKVGEDISPEQLVEINNLVQRLDKNTLDLGAALTENSNNETAGETI
ncbi:MAG: MBL fold metallo-hydrolase [Eubacteriaceae bacterium]|nr:MBL fold metallo-hydrolase [Eubacteriaceae bacterium]